MKIFKKVAAELAKEGKPILWIFDSFCQLVTNTLDDNTTNKAYYRGLIRDLFDLNEVLIPVLVCSSATTSILLGEGTCWLFVLY
jgi:hypothetical protein